MSREKGLVFDIQAQSVHDGPGSRTLVFLTGCPLKCKWCANPEGMMPGIKLRYFAKKCKYNDENCTRCIDACPNGAINITNDKEIPLKFDRNICKNCKTFDCVKACYHDALENCSNWMSVDELMKILNRDRAFWSSNGGVTFSGGEPFYQKEFLLTMLKKCKEAYIHTAIETCSFVKTETFLETMQYVDFAFTDIKHMDAEKHKDKTGASNELILNNISKLAKSWPGRLILRIPIIEGYNNSKENINATADFMKKNGLYEINILPYHPLGESKWEQLGFKYPYSGQKSTPDERLKDVQEMFLMREIACYVGSYTPF